MNYENAVLG